MDIIQINQLHFSYHRDQPVLHNINLNVKQGEWISILGHNGSGKSTLAKLMVGLLKADTGDITIFGIKLDETTVSAIRRKVGIVFQNPDNQFVGVTVKHDIAFGLENMQKPREEMIALVHEFSRRVGMEDYLSKEPHHLSGGQKQRVAIAGLLAMNLDVMIFDEATSMLDPEGTKSVIELIQELKTKYNKTIISITHDLDQAAKSDRLIVLHQGRVLADDTPHVIFKQVNMLEQAELDIPFQLKLYNAVKNDPFLNHVIPLRDALWHLSSNK